MTPKGNLQIGNIPLILGIDLFPVSIRQEVRGIEIIHKRRTIHHRHTTIQPSDLAQSSRSNELRQLLSVFWRLSRIDGKTFFDFLESGGSEGFGEFGGECFRYLDGFGYA